MKLIDTLRNAGIFTSGQDEIDTTNFRKVAEPIMHNEGFLEPNENIDDEKFEKLSELFIHTIKTNPRVLQEIEHNLRNAN